MKLRKLTVVGLALALGAAALGTASATDAKPKPGLLPGKWQGTGVISGSVTDEVATTTFTGKLGFRLVVAKDLNVKGTGSWVKTMKGRGEFGSSNLTGIGQMLIAGTANDVDFLYTEDVAGTITDAYLGKPAPVRFKRGEDEPLLGRLIITKARTCSAHGFIPTSGESGVKIKWSAKKLGRCSE